MCGTARHRSWAADSRRKRAGDCREVETFLKPSAVSVADCSLRFRLRQFSSYCGGGSFYLLIKHVSYLTFGSSCIKISRSVSLGDKITGCGFLIRAHPLVSTCACAVRCSIYLVDAANTPSILVPMAN